MITKIDWLSWSLALPGPISGAGQDSIQHAETVLRTYLGDELADALLDAKFTPEGGRAPYTTRMMREDHFVSVFWGESQRHMLVEVSGGGCEDLERRGQLYALLDHVRPRLTRLDIAVDMLVDTEPGEFVSAGYSPRFKTTSHIISDTGATFYVGSRESERYARVYRYAPPHPRAAWLRCEFVLRHENATATAAAIADVGILGVAAQLGNSYGWKHPVWKPEFLTDQTIPTWRPERRQGATVRWLITSVFPSMARLVKEGVIEDVDAFLDQHLYNLIE